MDLFYLMIALTSIQLASSKERKISVKLNVPTFLNSLFGLDNIQKTIQATVVTSGEQHTNLAFDLSMKNKTRYKEGGLGIVQRSNQKEQQKVDLLKINMQGIDDALSFVKAMRAFLPTNLTQLAKTLKMIQGIELDHPTLEELVAANKMRSQKIHEYNFQFPKWFTNSRRRLVSIPRPLVESGPGTIKTEIITYPSNFLAKRLKFLVAYAKKQQEKDQAYKRLVFQD